MTPASNFKLLVSATALEKLGPDFTYATEVYARGKVEKGVLDGDLILKGGGDPVLETADLTDLAKQVKAAGISQVKGSVLPMIRCSTISGWDGDGAGIASRTTIRQRSAR
jgi:serine-type D-Ala-D-Ala carboxypeptidase/endopeptidase (penicillin-binding protein 4)